MTWDASLKKNQNKTNNPLPKNQPKQQKKPNNSKISNVLS